MHGDEVVDKIYPPIADPEIFAKVRAKEILEKFVLDSIITELKKPGQMDYIVHGLLALQESQIKANSTLSILEREQKQNENAMENIMNTVERGFYTAAANKRMKGLEDRQEELERLIIIECSKMQVKVTASEIRAYYEEALTKEPQMLINFLICESIVFDNEIHIYFNRTGPDASQGLSVCDRETTIPAHIQNSYELNGRIYGLRSPSKKLNGEKEKQPKPNNSI